MAGNGGRGCLVFLALLLVPVTLLGCVIRSLYGVKERHDDRRREVETFVRAPVAVVAVASPSAAPAKLPLSYPAGELATAATWPRACAILTDDDIRAFLPQAGHFWMLEDPEGIADVLTAFWASR